MQEMNRLNGKLTVISKGLKSVKVENLMPLILMVTSIGPRTLAKMLVTTEKKDVSLPCQVVEDLVGEKVGNSAKNMEVISPLY